MMDKVFICAPVTGFDIRERRTYFSAVAHRIAANGFHPMNPLRSAEVEGMTSHELVAECIRTLLSSNLIMLCDGWEDSTQCQRMATVALWCGITVLPKSAVGL